jgi:hypothetical protein
MTVKIVNAVPVISSERPRALNVPDGLLRIDSKILIVRGSEPNPKDPHFVLDDLWPDLPRRDRRRTRQYRTDDIEVDRLFLDDNPLVEE